MSNRSAMLAKLAELETEVARAVAGGGEKYVERHHARGKLLARERIELLVDEGSAFLVLSPLAGWGSDFTVGASVVTVAEANCGSEASFAYFCVRWCVISRMRRWRSKRASMPSPRMMWSSCFASA